ncbi:MAG: hypothetical protein GY855_13025, partial [candidate division Zixibacteria bacterium]|nr:hypothetical protein [candidate division Zixibacteria bacterium]
GLYLIKSDGSEMRLLLEQTVLLSYPAFSPDGQWISFSQDGQICKISFDGAQIDTLTEKEYYFPSSWSPDGSQIAYELRPGDNRGIWIMDSDGNNSELRIPYAHDPDWSYSDSIIYVNFDGIHSSGAICIADTSGSAIRIIFDVSDNFVPVGNIPELHRESSIIVFNPQVPGEMQDIWLVNLDGTNLRRVTDFSATFPSFSPDGSRIVYTDNRDGHLWTMNLDGSNKIKVTGIQ